MAIRRALPAAVDDKTGFIVVEYQDVFDAEEPVFAGIHYKPVYQNGVHVANQEIKFPISAPALAGAFANFENARDKAVKEDEKRQEDARKSLLIASAANAIQNIGNTRIR